MQPLVESVFYWSDLFGTTVFAFSGVLVAGRLRMDGFGVIVLAAVTAIGGGTIRDLIIKADTVFWTADTLYLWVILATALLGQYIAKLPRRLPWYILPLADAFGLATFTIIGTEKALNHGTSGMVAVVMGVITGVAGGMIRDVLAREVPMVLQREIYATACILGGILYTCSLEIGITPLLATLFGMLGTFTLRVAAIRWHLSLPAFSLNR
ncbi:trimeric intracellular cation channel family protein [Oceanisphaera pacifica]|uniref:Trimeric intracellular cation channel family protein n=1 Tax=Oceanisphaera pacifica TaxID=2818389 RepID=A0ABS3NIE4_9GAMM|nr:trimeric intracellular cation channel family protein [Oceanisphaera pacifica]MBO1520361.1 trimeric intracellular cation channel family protein [Oceanisphaera pacifica]